MALKFGKSKDEGDEKAAKATGTAKGAKGAKGAKATKQPSFMRRGKSAHDERERASKRQEERREQLNGTWRFWLREGNDATLTFLDGHLDDDGMLDVPSFYEHTVPYGKRFVNIACTAKNDLGKELTEPCPLCEGDSDPSYVGVFTVLEHLEKPWKDDNGVEHKYRKRLLIAKLRSLRMLNKKAVKLDERHETGGLVGCTFEVSRSDGRAARIGDDYDFVSYTPHDELVDSLDKPEDAQPADYESEPELKWRTAEEIVEMGLGVPQGRSVGGKGKGSKASEYLDD